MAILPRSSVSSSVVRDLSRIVGEDAVSTADGDRLAYGRDFWTRDVLQVRVGRVTSVPEVVVWPKTPEEVSQILSYAARAELPVVPYGTGSGRSGGSRSSRGGIALDIKRMKEVRSLAKEDLLLEVEAGILGGRLELWLNTRGYTLGHIPESIVSSTLGGWLSTRSVGHLSSQYGSMADRTVGLEFVTPGRVRRYVGGARSEGGPNWNNVIMGSEGRLGVMTSALLRVQPQPETRIFASYRLSSITRGVECIRRVMRMGVKPSVVRLYDTSELKKGLGERSEEAPDGGLMGIEAMLPRHLSSRRKATLGSDYLDRVRQNLVRRAAQSVLGLPVVFNKAREVLGGDSLLIFAFEGDAQVARAEADVVKELVSSEGGEDLGVGPSQDWFNHQRFETSFRDRELYAAGLFVEQLDVAATWDRVLPLHRSVKRAVSTDVLVTSTFTHANVEGCAIEFTFTGVAGDLRNLEEVLERYDRTIRFALHAVNDSGGAISHHAGVGEARSEGMLREHGVAGMRFLSILAEAFDSAEIMNPGKLGITRQKPPRSPSSSSFSGVPKALTAAVGPRNIVRDGKKTLIRPPDERALAAVFRVANSSSLTLVCDQSRAVPRSECVHVDLERFDGITRISERSLFVEVEAGVLIERLEAVLHAHDLVLGPLHPRSRGMSVGAALAHQALIRRSIGLGQIQDIALAVRIALPSGETIETRPVPHASTGPRVAQLFIGGEGRFGWIVKATLRVAKQLSENLSFRLDFETFSDAIEAVRVSLQTGTRPMAARAWSEAGKGFLAVQLMAASPELMAAHVGRLRQLAQKHGGELYEDTRFLASEGDFDRTSELEFPWSALKQLIQGSEWMRWGDVWVDFMTPESATLVVRSPDRFARKRMLAYAKAQGVRVLSVDSEASRSETHFKSTAYDDISRSIAQAMDPGRILF